MLDLQTRVDRKLLEEMYERGYSRIPIYDQNRAEVKGVLMSKDLILMNPDKDNPTIEQISSILREPSMISKDTNAMAALDIFLKEKKHLHFVTENKTIINDKGVKVNVTENVGIITLEDIIEALMNKAIADEMDNDDEEKNNNNVNAFALAEQRKLRDIKRHDVV